MAVNVIWVVKLQVLVHGAGINFDHEAIPRLDRRAAKAVGLLVPGGAMANLLLLEFFVCKRPGVLLSHRATQRRATRKATTFMAGSYRATATSEARNGCEYRGMRKTLANRRTRKRRSQFLELSLAGDLVVLTLFRWGGDRVSGEL